LRNFKINDQKNSSLILVGGFAFLIFLFLACISYFFKTIDYFNAIPGDLIDPRFNNVILEHIYGWLIGRWPSLWSPLFFFPFKNVLAFSDNHFGSVVFYALLRFVGFSRELSMSGWVLIGCVLNFLATFWVIKRLGFSAFGASAGAFVFSASLPVLGFEEYAQLIYRFAIPLAFYYFWRFLNNKDVVSLGWAAIWTAEQFYCSIYLGVFLVYLLVALFIASLFVLPSGYLQSLRRGWKNEVTQRKLTALAGIFFGVLATTILLWKYYLVAKEYSFHRVIADNINLLPKLSSYLLADNSRLSSFVGGWVDNIAWRHPQQLFIGIGVFLLLIYGLWVVWHKKLTSISRFPAAKSGLIKTSCITLLLLFLFTLNFNGHSLYQFVFLINGLSSVQYVSRIILVMLLPISLVIAFACDSLQKNIAKNAYQQVLLIPVIGFLLAIEPLFFSSYRTPIADWKGRITEITSLMNNSLSAKANSNNILFIDKRINVYESVSALDAMIISQDLGIPTINGYSGNIPSILPAYLTRNGCFTTLEKLIAFEDFSHFSRATTTNFEARIFIIPVDTLPQYIEFNIPDVTLGEPIVFGNSVLNPPYHLECGWERESIGMWSTQYRAKLILPMPKDVKNLNKPLSLELKVITHTNPSHLDQKVLIKINGQPLKFETIGIAPNVTISIPLSAQITYQRYLALEFILPDAISPLSLKMGTDSRTLGIKLINAKFI